MPKLVCRVGKPARRHRYDDLRFERQGFLNIFSFRSSTDKHRQELMDRGHAVVILAVDVKRRELILIEQPRHSKAFVETATGRDLLRRARRAPVKRGFSCAAGTVRTLELPAGIIENGEEPLRAALRELHEETGFRLSADRLRPVNRFYASIGGCTETVIGYLAVIDGIKGKPRACGDGSETISVWRHGWDEAFRLVDAGTITSATSIVLLDWLRICTLERKTGCGGCTACR